MMNVVAWADTELERNGDYVGLVFDGQEWPSRVLHDHAARFASALRALGVAEGERVVVVLPNGPELVVAFPAILRAGAVAVLVHPGATAAEIERVITHAEATALVTTAALATRAPAGAPRVRIATGRRPAGWESFEQLVEQHAPLAEPVPRASDDLAQISYTAGTTGTPKGVVFTHAMLAARLRLVAVQQNRRDPAAAMVLLAVLPMGHAFGTVALLHRFVVKTKLICMAEFDPSAVLQAIETHRVEYAPLVPAMAEALLASPELGRRDTSSLRGLAVGGAPVSEDLAERMAAAFGFRPTVGYGMTELPGITFNTGTSKRGSVGRLIPGVVARIVDRELRDLPVGEVGEVLVKAPWMSASYYGAAGGATKLRDGWLHTGDLGYFDADKELFLVGRSKEIIIQAGNNVYPQEVIDVVARMPGVEECAVVGVPNELLGEEVVACVVSAAGATLTAEAVIAHCRAGLDVRKVPVRVHFVGELPKTELGKVKAHVLREQIERARAAVLETELVRLLRADPAADRRERLREVIEARLRAVLRTPRPAIAPRTPFGELGLDSLGAVELSNVLGRELGRSLPPTLTFRSPTIDAVTDFVLEELFGAAPVPEARERVVGEREPIAVIGVGCRMPGGVTTPALLWELLEAGTDATRDIDRWDMDAIYDPIRGTPGKTYARRAALIDGPDMFDAELFGMTPREASDLDPQHRLLLETVWEALEHAGRDPLAQRGEHAGVFVGISGSSYAGGQAGLGVLPSMAAGRISYFFDLDGPSFPIDTACSSSLVAIHNAVRSLRLGECDLALAGGVNVMSSPESFIGLSAIQALAPDGRCKAFDASADGFGRGEGSVMFVLRRLADARADGDRILGVIRGTAINHDGRSSSLTAPNGKAQENVIRAALADADVRPADIKYLEAHGTGTPLGDPIEVEAATVVLGSGRDPADKLAIGSLKTNVGHLEAAAGAAGVLKVLLAFEHEALPATLHQHRLNPMLAPFAHTFEVTSHARPWRRGPRPRLAGVTSLGMSGTNAHVVLEEPPREVTTAADVDGAHVLPLSARTGTALAELARRYADHLASSGAAVADVSFTASVGRAHLAHRIAVVAGDRDEMIAKLREHAGDAAARSPARAPKLGFMFTGQGSQYVGMGRRLYETERTFRQALQRCAELLQGELPRPLLDVLFAEPRAGELTLDDTALAQPALFALEWALAELWRSWGIEPAFVLGHSLGEYVAACVAGVFSVEDGLRLTAARGRLMQALPRDGAMIAIATDEAAVQAAIGAHAERISISAINGPRATVVSGEARAVAAVAAELATTGVQTRALRVSHGFHSPLIDPILDEFERTAAAIALAPPQLAWISTLTGQRALTDEVTRPSYWRRQIREPVRFADAITTMVREGARGVVELGPNPILIAMGQQCVTGEAAHRLWLPSLRRDHDDRVQILSSLGELYVQGGEPRWSGLYRDRPRKVALPTYPFERQRYWAVAWGGSSAARTAPLGRTGAGNAPARESARAVLQRELAALPLEERARVIVEHARGVLGRVLGRATDAIAADRDLFHEGLDSLRVMDFLGGLRQRLGLELTTADLMARPSLAAFAAHVADQLGPAVAGTASPLITLNGEGSAAPIVCLHPSGGDVTAYLRLRTLLGEDVPLYALQSRATQTPESEHATLAAMAADYAEVIRRARPAGPIILAGWSMGGVTAHAVAVELERAGVEVALVAAIDSTARAETASDLQQLSLALTGVIFDVAAASPPSPELIDRQLRALFTSRIPRDRILAWCEEHQLIAAGSVTPERFDVMMRLRYRHFQLVGEHPRGVIRAPMRVWWAQGPLGDWAPHTTGGVTEVVLGANHFTAVRSPHLETIAADLARAAKRSAR